MLDYLNFFKNLLPIKSINFNNNDLSLIINKQELFNILNFLKNSEFFKYDILVDIICTELKDSFNFELTYILLSVINSYRINIKLLINNNDEIHSISNIYFNSDWMEREVWDLYGIFFKYHNDLRKILTDYGFKGNPLKKAFPISGFFDVKYDFYNKMVVSTNLTKDQRYKFFNYKTPWV